MMTLTTVILSVKVNALSDFSICSLYKYEVAAIRSRPYTPGQTTTLKETKLIVM